VGAGSVAELVSLHVDRVEVGGLRMDLGKEAAKMMCADKIIEAAQALFPELEHLEFDARVDAINELRKLLHQQSPFSNEPVDCVLWIPFKDVIANDYNPNQVAPPEMKLLEHSIQEDGYTQPIVSWLKDGVYEVIDGFHRNRVARESLLVQARVSGYLPLSIVNTDREDRGDRIASTIRHNRARGKHRIDSMSEIVVELKRRNWSDSKIGRELGMDPDEVLRLSQISGLAEMFADHEFTEAWEADTSVIDMEDTLAVEMS